MIFDGGRTKPGFLTSVERSSEDSFWKRLDTLDFMSARRSGAVSGELWKTERFLRSSSRREYSIF